MRFRQDIPPPATEVITIDVLGDEDALEPRPLRLGATATRLAVRCAPVKAWVERRSPRVARRALIISLGLALGTLIYWELNHSVLEAHFVAEISTQLGYHVEPGESERAVFPKTGPYDLRLGYALMPDFLQRLGKADYVVTAQARLSPVHEKLVRFGFTPVFQEKPVAGLKILDAGSRVLAQERYPRDGYARLSDVPSLVVSSLLFIEDRQVLDETNSDTLNPAISWSRLGRASLELLLDKLGSDRNVPGGSTLATQIEKFRHAHEGRTHGPADKLRQLGSATTRAYLWGRDTTAAREQIVLDYINSVPLGSVPRLGEVIGLGEGVQAWYGTSLAELQHPLTATPNPADEALRLRQAKAFKRVLALFIAQRRPTYYLQQNQAALDELADSYVRMMARAKIIPSRLAADALTQRIALIPPHAPRTVQEQTFISRKAVNAVRFELARDLGNRSLYELDRYDVEVKSTFERELQQRVTDKLIALKTREGAIQAGVVGERMLRPEQAPHVNYSFTLLERQDDHNAVRAQADTVEGPLDANLGGKLELGSTAKLRTLLTYLEMVGEVHAKWTTALPGPPAPGLLTGPQGFSKKVIETALAETSPEDTLSLWVLSHLKDEKNDRTLAGTLDAAFQRRFSANPWTPFWTGGGQVTFNNFDASENGLELSVAQAFQKSNNLVFVRLMKEIVQHTIVTRIPSAKELLADVNHPLRRTYLELFVERESETFLRKHLHDLRPLTPAQRMEKLKGAPQYLSAPKLASLLLSIRPSMGFAEFRTTILATFPMASEERIVSLFETLHPNVMSLHDRAYVARAHPLALWVVGYLEENPKATLKEAFEASREARFDAYTWLLEKSSPRRQERDIRTMLEREAFRRHIVKYWKRQGFPFNMMAPSYASALGSSGDRPSALGDLMGAILNDGVLMPARRIDELRFARHTPYETHLAPCCQGASRMVSPEVAAVAKRAVLSVVDGGTAVRLRGALKRSDGTDVAIGAKTGTGDNRLEIYGPGGRLLRSEAKSRTATLVFSIGDRFFGTITAYVKADQGAKVDDFNFTSSLVAQALKSILPAIGPTVLKVEDPWAYMLHSSVPAAEEEAVDPG